MAAQCTLGTASICFCQEQAGRCCRAGLSRCHTTTRATHSWVRWPLNASMGTGKGPLTVLLGGHSFEGISHPWFISPAPRWNSTQLVSPALSQVFRDFCTSVTASALQGLFWNVYDGRVASPSLQDGRCMCLHGPGSPGGPWSAPWFHRRERETIDTKCLRQSK